MRTDAYSSGTSEALFRRTGQVTRLGYPYLRRHGLRHTELTWMADAVHVLRKIWLCA